MVRVNYLIPHIWAFPVQFLCVQNDWILVTHSWKVIQSGLFPQCKLHCKYICLLLLCCPWLSSFLTKKKEDGNWRWHEAKVPGQIKTPGVVGKSDAPQPAKPQELHLTVFIRDNLPRFNMDLPINRVSVYIWVLSLISLIKLDRLYKPCVNKIKENFFEWLR